MFPEETRLFESPGIQKALILLGSECKEGGDSTGRRLPRHASHPRHRPSRRRRVAGLACATPGSQGLSATVSRHPPTQLYRPGHDHAHLRVSDRTPIKTSATAAAASGRSTLWGTNMEQTNAGLAPPQSHRYWADAGGRGACAEWDRVQHGPGGRAGAGRGRPTGRRPGRWGPGAGGHFPLTAQGPPSPGLQPSSMPGHWRGVILGVGVILLSLLSLSLALYCEGPCQVAAWLPVWWHARIRQLPGN